LEIICSSILFATEKNNILQDLRVSQQSLWDVKPCDLVVLLKNDLFQEPYCHVVTHCTELKSVRSEGIINGLPSIPSFIKTSQMNEKKRWRNIQAESMFIS
jgi:hypothetical protein